VRIVDALSAQSVAHPLGAVDTGTWFRDLDDGVARRDVHALVVAKKK